MAQDSIRWMHAFFSSAISLTQPHLWQPSVDVYRTRYGWLIKYDLAGVLPGDVNLTFDGSRLTIRGTRRDCTVEEGCHAYCMEISYSHFERTLELPENIERAQLSTEFHHGMLLVRVQKEARR
jgi:HSP20 family protein